VLCLEPNNRAKLFDRPATRQPSLGGEAMIYPSQAGPFLILISTSLFVNFSRDTKVHETLVKPRKPAHLPVLLLQHRDEK
jgi:hypothetical protein